MIMKNNMKEIKLKVIRINPNARIPNYAYHGDTGFDLYPCVDFEIKSGETKVIGTGLKFGIPEGYGVQIRPRSGNSLKTKLRVSNSPGSIDMGYINEVGIIIDNIGEETIFWSKEKAIAQGVIEEVIKAEFEEVSEIKATERGLNGFGSSNKK
jgi:dUTP pyrophosphatase